MLRRLPTFLLVLAVSACGSPARRSGGSGGGGGQANEDAGVAEGEGEGEGPAEGEGEGPAEGEGEGEGPAEGEGEGPAEGEGEREGPAEGEGEGEGPAEGEGEGAAEGEGEGEGVCEDDCGDLWATACTDDAHALRQCVPDPDQPGCTRQGRRISCNEDRTCADATCTGACTRPEIVVVVDRSSSMEGGRWLNVSTVVGEWCRMLSDVASVRLRLFPSDDACAAGDVVPCDGIPDAAPSPQGETPIAAALAGLDGAFGDPNEAQAVVLITDGDETCAGELDALEPVMALRAAGVRTFAVGVSNEANSDLLGRIALTGGTAAGARGFYRADGRRDLWEALVDVSRRLSGCECTDADVATPPACFGLSFHACDGETHLREVVTDGPGASCACGGGGPRCTDIGVIRCEDRRWVQRADDRQGVSMCSDGAAGRCGGAVVIEPPPECGWMLEASDVACTDGLDNDDNGFTDCADWSCSRNPDVRVCPRGAAEDDPAECADGVDNDGNGFTDCDDFGCSRNRWVAVCPGSEHTNARCGNGVDDDADGRVDCADPDCFAGPLVDVCGDRCTPQVIGEGEQGWVPVVDAPDGSCVCDGGRGACTEGWFLRCDDALGWIPAHPAGCHAEVEAPGDDDGPDTALPLPELPVVVTGRCDPAWDDDWFWVDLRAGDALSLETGPLQGGRNLSTELWVVDPDGDVLRLQQGGGFGGYAAIDGLVVAAPGRYRVGVVCLQGPGDYYLRARYR